MVQVCDLSSSIRQRVLETSAEARFVRALEYGLAEHLCAFVGRFLCSGYQASLESSKIQEVFNDTRYELELLKGEEVQDFLAFHKLSLSDLQSYCAQSILGRLSLYDREYESNDAHDVSEFTEMLCLFLLCSATGNQFAYSFVKEDCPEDVDRKKLCEELEAFSLSEDFKARVASLLNPETRSLPEVRSTTTTMIERLIALSVVLMDSYVTSRVDEQRELVLLLKEKDTVVDSLLASGRFRKERISIPGAMLPFYFFKDAARVYSLPKGSSVEVSTECGGLIVTLIERKQLLAGVSVHE